MATLTVYPEPGVTVDGSVRHGGIGNQTWAEVQGSAGTSANDSDTTGDAFFIQSDTGTNKWQQLWRAIFLFDTSALTAGAIITAATMSLFGTTKSDELAITPNVNIYSSAPASDSALVAGDFDSLGTTAFCDTAITYASLSTIAYNDFAFNATGLGAISKTGVSKFGSRNANYDVAIVTPTWSSDALSRFTVVMSDTALTTADPKLVVTYTLPVVGGTRQLLTLLGVS